MSSVWAVISSSGSQPGQTSKELRCYERHSKPTDTKWSRFLCKEFCTLKVSVLRSTITLCSLIQGTSIQPNVSEYRLVAMSADESMAANVLRINGTVCM